MAKLTRQRIEELQAQALPSLDWHDLLTITEGNLTNEEQQALTDYFGRFVDLPRDEDGGRICLGCGGRFGTSGIMGFLMAPGRVTWNWAIAHGECYCSGCGYPARALHYDVGPLKRLEVTLAYHPSGLVAREQADAS